MSNLVVRTPQIIATEINAIKDQTKKIVLSASIEIGRRLVEAKEMLGHGEWGPWLEANVDYSQRNANNLMKLFSEYGSDQMNLLGDNLKSQAFSNLSYTQAIALLGISQEERETFIEENKVEEMSTRELQKAIKERDAAVKEKESLENELSKNKDKIDKLNEIEAEKDKISKEMHNNLEKFNLEKELVEQEKQRAIVALDDAERKIKELEARPIEVNTHAAEEDILKAKQEVERKYQEQLEQLKKAKIEAEERVKKLEESKPTQPNNADVKFRVLFEDLKESFNKVLVELDHLEDKQKYSGAVKKLIGIMGEKL